MLRLPYFTAIIDIDTAKKCRDALRLFAQRKIGKHSFSRICGKSIVAINKHRDYIEAILDIVVAPAEYNNLVGGIKTAFKTRKEVKP